LKNYEKSSPKQKEVFLLKTSGGVEKEVTIIQQETSSGKEISCSESYYSEK
jgi:hypothetical protein